MIKKQRRAVLWTARRWVIKSECSAGMIAAAATGTGTGGRGLLRPLTPADRAVEENKDEHNDEYRKNERLYPV